jgi:uncharacterized protein YhbP (UPF0306 family)
METGDLIKQYLSQGKMMQIATVNGDQPWICTVYFVEDEQLNLYWLSLPTRRHSQDIKAHNKVAVAIPIKTDQPVIGIQAEGTAEVVNEHETIAKIMKLYTVRYNVGKSFYNNFVAGKNEHCLYRFMPTNFVLFDEVTSQDNTRKEWSPTL